MKAIVDRIEGSLAVLELEDGSFIDVNLIKLPSKLKEGDCLNLVDNQYVIDRKETSLRNKRIKALMNELFEDEEN